MSEAEMSPNDAVHGEFVPHGLDLARAVPERVRLLLPLGIGTILECSAHPQLMPAGRELLRRFSTDRSSADGESRLRCESATPAQC